MNKKTKTSATRRRKPNEIVADVGGTSVLLSPIYPESRQNSKRRAIETEKSSRGLRGVRSVSQLDNGIQASVADTPSIRSNRERSDTQKPSVATGGGQSITDNHLSSALSTQSNGSQSVADIHLSRAAIGDDRADPDIQASCVVPIKFNGGQNKNDTQHNVAAIGDDQKQYESHASTVIATIQELHRRRQTWHRAEKSLTLQAKAVCRRYVGGDKDKAEKLFAAATNQSTGEAQSTADVAVAILPLMMARDNIEKHRLSVEKELTKMAKGLPIWPWCESIRGFGPLSLALLVGECGNIGSYKSVSAVWKRMGLAVINGERQRRVAGPDAVVHGYSPQRRAVAWNIGVSLMRAQKVGEPYRDFYDLEKAKQLAKGLTKGHSHNRACRHMTKRFLANLYGAYAKIGRQSVDEVQPTSATKGKPEAAIEITSTNEALQPSVIHP